MGYTVYILQSEKDGSYYIGQCEDLVERLRRHNEGREKATVSRGFWKVEHTEVYGTRSEAMKRERAIKGKKSRRYIETLIRGVAQPG